jgi:hypothetical protein
MMFEDNVGEDGISAQSPYTLDINDSNYIDNLAPYPAIFDNEVPLGMDTCNCDELPESSQRALVCQESIPVLNYLKMYIHC